MSAPGEVRCDELPDGTYGLRLRARGFAEASSPAIELGEGRRRVRSSVVLGTGGGIRGTVRFAGPGELPAGLEIRASRRGDSTLVPGVRPGAGGNFCFQGLSAGTYVVSLAGAGVFGARPAIVRVGAGDPEAGVELDVVPALPAGIAFVPLGLLGASTAREIEERNALTTAELDRIEAWRRHVRVVVKDAEGHVWFDAPPEFRHRPPLTADFAAPAGVYDLSILDGERMLAASRFAVPGPVERVVIP